VGAITRLMDMGIEPFLISSSLVGIVAQRLVRVLCKDCREAYTPTPEQCEFLQQDPASPPTIYRAKGCDECNQLGYRGRIGIYEVVEITEAISSRIHKRAGELELEREARKSSPSIHADGVRKILEGTTSMEEVLRVTHRGR
jgi:general secretion pathway protein E